MTLGRLPVLFRFILLFLFFSIPLAALGMLFFGPIGAGVGVGIIYLLLLGAAIASESKLIPDARLIRDPSVGLKTTFNLVLRDLSRHERRVLASEPRVFVFVDPRTAALCGKGLLGRGAILVSTGMLVHFSEPELREILKICFLRLQKPEWIFVSLCNTLLRWLLFWAPRAWVALFFSSKSSPSMAKKGSPLSFAWFLVLLPWIKFLVRMGQAGRKFEGSGQGWNGAMRKSEDPFTLSLLWV